MKQDHPGIAMPQYDHMISSWVKIQTVLDGTTALRDAGENYLPRHDEETQLAYADRLERATLMNMSKLTLDSWVGRPFSEPIVLKEDVPKSIVVLAEDIDQQGNHLNVFSRNWFREGMAKSYAHVLIDMPRRDENEDGSPRTRAQDEGIRPYWVFLSPEQVFFADSRRIDGKDTLIEVRILETRPEREGFSIVEKKVIRQLVLMGDRVIVTLWQENEDKRQTRSPWIQFDQYPMDIDEIPLVTFYSDRHSFMLGKSPLEDLVDLNVAQWQSTSDQRMSLTTARFPMLALSGGSDEGQKLVVGPNRWLNCPDPQGRFYYVEHTGAALNSGRQELEDLVRQMGEYGAEFLKKRPGRETATARTLDEAGSTSPLQDAVRRFIDAVENALRLTAKWMGEPQGGSVEIKSDFASPAAGAEGLRTLLESAKEKLISREAYQKELIRAKILDADFDVQADLGRLEAETMDMTGLPSNGMEDDDGDE